VVVYDRDDFLALLVFVARIANPITPFLAIVLKDRKLFQNAMRLLCHVIEHTGDLTLLTDGERRYGSLVFELWSEALRTGKRGRPKQTLRQGVKVRLKNTGTPRPKRGPKRPQYQAPSPEHPDPVQPVATTEMHANHVEAFHASLRRRCAT
jgi:hypothetical protein